MAKMGDRIDFGLAFIIALIGYSFRAIIRAFQDNKHFMNIDSYHYLKASDTPKVLLENFRNWFGVDGTLIILYIITGLTFALFYFLCRNYTNRISSFIASLMFSLSPLVFLNNQFGLFDKNIYSLFMIVLIMFVISLKDNLNKIISLISLLILFSFMWDGYIGMVIIVCIYYLVKIIMQKDAIKSAKIITLLLVFVFVIRLAIKPFKGLAISPQYFLTSEVNPIFFMKPMPELLMIAFVWILVSLKISKDKKIDKNLVYNYLFPYTGLLITIFGFIIMFRLNIFLMPFLYLCLSIIIENRRYLTYFGIVLFLGIMIFSVNSYAKDPMIDDKFVSDISKLDKMCSNSCIISTWEYGYIYDYHSDKSVPYEGSSVTYDKQIDYLVRGKNTDCVIIYRERDYDILKYMIEIFNYNITTDEYYINNTESFELKNFNIVKETCK